MVVLLVKAVAAEMIDHVIMIREIQRRAPTRWRMRLLGTSKMK